MGCMKNNLKIPCGVVLYLDFPEREDNHLRKLAGIRRYASVREWEVQTITRRELDCAAVKATCVGEGGRPKPIGCIVETLADYRSILPPRLFGDVPVVYLDPSRPLNWRGAAVVACDNAAVAAAAYDELSAGMPQCYAAVPSCSAFPWNRERIDAFRVLCAADGRELRVFPARRREPKERRVARLAKWLAGLPSRSAVFAANDTVAKDIAEAASAIPRHIPRELTVIGVDGEPGAEDHGMFRAFGERPGLSSVKLDFELAGYEAARLLGELVALRASPSPSETRTAVFGPLCVLRRESTRGPGRREQFVMEAVDVIRREACEGLTAAALAGHFDCSRRLFELRFREAMGHSVLDEILHVRLEKAQTLLMRRDIPIARIAPLCGFRTGIELRKLFRLRFKTSMRRWRKNHAPDGEA